MPQMGPIVGYAVTVQIQPGSREHVSEKESEYLKQISQLYCIYFSPKIVVVQDLGKPACYGAFWGEVNSNIHKS